MIEAALLDQAEDVALVAILHYQVLFLKELENLPMSRAMEAPSRAVMAGSASLNEVMNLYKTWPSGSGLIPDGCTEERVKAAYHTHQEIGNLSAIITDGLRKVARDVMLVEMTGGDKGCFKTLYGMSCLGIGMLYKHDLMNDGYGPDPRVL